MEKQKPDIDYEALKKKTIEQFRSGKSLFVKDGAFAPLLKQFLEAALESELDAHLDEDQREQGNRKNGRTSKKLKTEYFGHTAPPIPDQCDPLISEQSEPPIKVIINAIPSHCAPL